MPSQQQWQGPERRQSMGHYAGPERRRQQAGYRDTGVNAEEPRTEQDESELHRTRGPDQRRK